MRKAHRFVCLAVLAAMIGWSPLPAAAQIKLTSLPERSTVLLHLDGGSTALVEEERVLTLQKGRNRVDFSWQGVRIDPDFIRLKALTHPEAVTLIDVSYPPGENSLVWEINSAGEWQERVRVSYLLSDLDSLVAYQAIADGTEKRLDLEGFLVVRNFSGEDFDTAAVVTDLGKTPPVVLHHEQTLRLPLFAVRDIPMTKVWTFDAALQPWDPSAAPQGAEIPVGYRIANTPAGGLGKSALPAGKVRIFQESAGSGALFLGEDRSAHLPVGEDATLTVGRSRDVVVTQRRMAQKRINVRRNDKNRVVLYDLEERIAAEVENFKDTPVVLHLRQHIPGQWEMQACSRDYTLEDGATLVFEIPLAPQGREHLEMRYIRRHLR